MLMGEVPNNGFKVNFPRPLARALPPMQGLGRFLYKSFRPKIKSAIVLSINLINETNAKIYKHMGNPDDWD